MPASPLPPAAAPGGPVPTPAAVTGWPHGLHLVAGPGAGGRPVPPADAVAPVVVLVHGSLDRGASFGRTIRRLPEGWAVYAYDRRGYACSRSGDTVQVAGHIGDLVAVATALGGPGRPVTAVGHSMGGVVVLGAAVAAPARFAAVGAFEPPMPWLGFRRDGGPADDPSPTDPALEAERFFRRMVGDAAWDRLPPAAKASRRADGPALAAELRSLHRDGPALFDVTDLAVPALFGLGGGATETRRRLTVTWLADHVADGHLFEIPDAGHGAHLSHPDAFADFVRATVALGLPAGGQPPRRGGPHR